MIDSKTQIFFDEIQLKLSQILSNKELSTSSIQSLKKRIKKGLNEEKTPIYRTELADYCIKLLIHKEKAKNQSELDKLCRKSAFLSKYASETDFELLKAQLSEIETDLEIEEDDFFDNDEEIINDFENSQYLIDKVDWFCELGLNSNPFPSEDGLYNIPNDVYENIILKTKIYQKYLEFINQNSDELLNKSIIFYGNFGCGKTTFFDYMSYKLLMKNILPIKIILNAQPSLDRIHQAFNDALFYEIVDYITNYSSEPSAYLIGKSKYEISPMLKSILKEREQRGFIVFLDGLHKSIDNQKFALNFLIELQNILEFYRRHNIHMGIFIAGSNGWIESIKNNSRLSGSIYTIENMGGITSDQAFELLDKRFKAFSSDYKKKFLKRSEMNLFVESLKITLATEITFRILIKEVLKRGIIFKSRIKLYPLVEEDILNMILTSLKDKKSVYTTFINLKKKFSDDIAKLSNILKVIVAIYETGYQLDSKAFYQKNKEFFKILEKSKIIVENNKYTRSDSKAYSLGSDFKHVFKTIENKVKFRPTHYLKQIFSSEKTNFKEVPEYKNILKTIERYKETNPQFEKNLLTLIDLTKGRYFNVVQQIEHTSNFEIKENNFEEINSILEHALKIVYILSEEKYPYETQEQIFNIFKYTWLDNDVLTHFFEWKENWKSGPKSKADNQMLLKSFIDAYESQITKLGKHLRYNKIIVVGSKDLNNKEKMKLNAARAHFASEEYKRSLEECHDLAERKLRSFIFNILKLIYGNDWQKNLPKTTNKMISNIQKKEKSRYSRKLSTDENKLFFLTRGAYKHIISDSDLWNECFSPIFGKAYRQFIIDALENIAGMGNLGKHNRKNEDFSKIANLIQAHLGYIKEIIEKINLSYEKILQEGFIYKQEKNIGFFAFRKNGPQIERLEPIKIDQAQSDKILKELQTMYEKETIFFDNYVDLSDPVKIRTIFSMDYRNVLVNLAYLISKGRLQIKDHFGSEYLFEIKT